MLRVSGTGVRWRELPKKYPPYQTRHRRLQHWVREDLLERILRTLAKELQTRGKLQPEEAFIDASFTGAKKWGLGVGPTKSGKGTKIIAPADDHSLPLAFSIESASPYESQQVEGVLGHSFLDTLPARLIGDRAYDSDRLDRDLVERYGIVMIAPHREVRRTTTHDGRPLRRYRKPWRVERLFAWLHHFRRLVIRWEYHVENFFGMVRLGCMQILIRYL
jgi:transposase